MKPAQMLKAFLTKCAETCVGQAKHHAEMSKGHASLVGGEDDSAINKFDKAASESHAERASAWTGLGETCCALADKCSKGEVGELEKLFGDASDQLEPSPVSIVAPDAPARGRLVLRVGQREVPADAVPAQFRKLVSIEDGSESEPA